jgi:hypothetical protein
MVKKFNLSEAAADILNRSISSARSKQDGPSRLPVSVVAGQKEVGDIGTEVTKTTDAGPDATKGGPTATPPGATPPVGSEPMKKLAGQPGQSAGADQGDPEGKPGKQMMQKNKNGVGIQSYGGQKNEEVDEDGNVIEEEKGEGHEDAAQDKAMIKKALAKKKSEMKEDIDALMAGENLSEEFVSKATTIFEAAVTTRVEAIAEEIENELYEQFESALVEVKEDFATKIDDYLNYMVEQWMEENQLAVDTGLRSEIVEDFIRGMRDLFAEHYIDIPEDKVNVVEELAAKVEELEEKLNEEMIKSKEFKTELKEHKKILAIQTACEGLPQTQLEKVKSLAENVTFTSDEEFSEKIGQLIEAYAPTGVKAAEKSVLEEGVEIEEIKDNKFVSNDPLVNAAAKSISKFSVK